MPLRLLPIRLNPSRPMPSMMNRYFNVYIFQYVNVFNFPTVGKQMSENFFHGPIGSIKSTHDAMDSVRTPQHAVSWKAYAMEFVNIPWNWIDEQFYHSNLRLDHVWRDMYSYSLDRHTRRLRIEPWSNTEDSHFTWSICPLNVTPFMTSAFVACDASAYRMSAFVWSLLLYVRVGWRMYMIFTRSTSPKHEKILKSWFGKRLQALHEES